MKRSVWTVAMVALSESGTTSCQFDNTWLFLIEE